MCLCACEDVDSKRMTGKRSWRGGRGGGEGEGGGGGEGEEDGLRKNDIVVVVGREEL